MINNLIYTALHSYTKSLSVALGYRDLLTRLHSDRVRELSEAIGVQYGLTSQKLDLLKIAASLHDIGKIGIPDRVLMKPSQLDEAKWEIMKRHSEMGEKIVAATGLEGSLQASLVIRYHHEYYNGCGYPDGIAGEEIPICSRIISIADSYDAMAVTRSYNCAKKHSEIMDILRTETGQKHDPKLMSIFCEIIEFSQFKVAEI